MNVEDMLSSTDKQNDALEHDCPAPLSQRSPKCANDELVGAGARRGWIAPFLLHLHQMLRRENPKILRWTDDGLAFQILDKEAMTKDVLPRYFKNKNFASFQRQLNYFGFRKWSKARARFPTYSRQHFTRDNYEEMALVKRQSKKSRKRRAPSETIAESDANPGDKYVSLLERCKPILPRPQLQHQLRTNDIAPISIPKNKFNFDSQVSPTPNVLAHQQPFSHQVALADAYAFTPFVPVISPARRVASGCKLPSLRELSFSSILSSKACHTSTAVPMCELRSIIFIY